MILKKEISVDYTVVPNEIHRHKLSLQAIGLYVYLLSKPNIWTFSYTGTEQQVSNGKHSIKASFKELEEKGFVKKRQKRKGGKLAENELILTDLSSSEKPLPENQSQVNTNKVNTKEEYIYSEPSSQISKTDLAQRMGVPKPQGASYEWQDTAVRYAQKLNIKTNASWFKFFKQNHKQQSKLLRTYQAMIDLPTYPSDPEKYFYKVFWQQ